MTEIEAVRQAMLPVRNSNRGVADDVAALVKTLRCYQEGNGRLASEVRVLRAQVAALHEEEEALRSKCAWLQGRLDEEARRGTHGEG